MIVNVYESGRDHQAARLDDLFALTRREQADVSNRIADDAQVSRVGFAPAAVNDQRADDDAGLHLRRQIR